MYLFGRLSHLANGHAHRFLKRDNVRLSYGLQWGGGKTLSAKSWLAAVHRLRKPYSAALAASEVEALCQIKRELIEDFGIPADKIGLYHSYRYDPHKAGHKGYASEPSTPVKELANRQFLLVTHNLVRTGQRNLDLYNRYKGKPRDLVIYDESLLLSEAWAIKTKQVKQGLQFLDLEIDEESRSDLRAIREYVAACLATMTPEATGVTSARLPELTDYAKDLQPDSAAMLLPTGCPKSVQVLLQNTGRELRVMSNGGRGAAWFQLKVPDELKSVMVLDASHVIRELPKLGSNITPDPKEPTLAFDYSGLTIDYFKHQAGRGFIEDECRKPVKQRKLAKKLAAWIKTLPPSERVLVWTFKHRGGRQVDIPSRLRQALTHFGVDLERVSVVTHGKARGSNAYGDHTAVAFYGVFEPDQLQTGAQMLGQYRDLAADLSNLRHVHFSEVMHEASQEIARSSVRAIDRGKAGSARVFFPCWHVEEVSKQLGSESTFADARMVHREDLEEPLANDKAEETKTEIVAKSIVRTLSELPKDTESISSKQLRPMVQERIGFEIGEHVWKDALANLTALPPYRESAQPPRAVISDTLKDVGWKRQSRGFARLLASDYGFSLAN